jgi:hypothetical protein
MGAGMGGGGRGGPGTSPQSPFSMGRGGQQSRAGQSTGFGGMMAARQNPQQPGPQASGIGQLAQGLYGRGMQALGKMRPDLNLGGAAQAGPYGMGVGQMLSRAGIGQNGSGQQMGGQGGGMMGGAQPGAYGAGMGDVASRYAQFGGPPMQPQGGGASAGYGGGNSINPAGGVPPSGAQPGAYGAGMGDIASRYAQFGGPPQQQGGRVDPGMPGGPGTASALNGGPANPFSRLRGT